MAPVAHDLSSGFRQWRSRGATWAKGREVWQAWARGGQQHTNRWLSMAESLKQPAHYSPLPKPRSSQSPEQAERERAWAHMAARLQLRPPVMRKHTTLMASADEQKYLEPLQNSLQHWHGSACQSSVRSYFEAGVSARRWRRCTPQSNPHVAHFGGPAPIRTQVARTTCWQNRKEFVAQTKSAREIRNKYRHMFGGPAMLVFGLK